MNSHNSLLRGTELDRTNFPELRDRILDFDAHGATWQCRTYPGYPRWPLLRLRPRAWPPLDRTLRGRRSVHRLDTHLPSRRTLSRLLLFGHGIHAPLGRGPVPSAGGLQALELFLVNLDNSWLPPGLFHYDRAGHHLSQLGPHASRSDWETIIPSLATVEGGAFLWVVAGETSRTWAKYGERGQRFQLLEAGHLMQNLCLLSASLGLSTVPLGGYFEREVAGRFSLPATDAVLYLGVCGRA